MIPRSPFAAALAAAAFFAVALVASPAALPGSQENIGRGRITGLIVDEAGQPLEGARIAVKIVDGKTTLEGVSDKKGRFAVAGLGTGNWRITASLAGYAEASVETPISQVRPNPPVTLTLKRIGGGPAIQADPESLAAIDRGNALEAEGRYDEAIALFRGFLEKYPDVYQVRANLGGARLKQGDLDGAEAEFKTVLERSGGASGDLVKDKGSAVRALTGLGEVALKRDDLESAGRLFSEALALSPEDEAAAYNVGEIFFSNQKLDEAMIYFTKATEIKPDWATPYYKLGLVSLNKADYAAAKEYFQKFLTLEPEGELAAQAKNILDYLGKM
jgi:tetratricopeptide (TPR) repeat protein